MTDAELKPCIDIGAKHSNAPLSIAVRPGTKMNLNVHICPVGHASWLLVGTNLQERRTGTLSQVDRNGATVPLEFGSPGTYQLTWGAASPANSWAVASVLEKSGSVLYNEAVQKDSALSNVLFSVTIEVTNDA